MNTLYFVKARSKQLEDCVWLQTAATHEEAIEICRAYVNPLYADKFCNWTAEGLCMTPQSVTGFEPV